MKRQDMSRSGTFIELKNADCPDALVWVRFLGTGRKVVLLHGWLHSGLSWNEVADRLQKNYRIIIPDFPGFGRSRPIDVNRITLEGYTDILTLLFDYLFDNEKPYGIVGHSMAGLLLLRLFQRNREYLPNKLVFSSVPVQGVPFLRPFACFPVIPGSLLSFNRKLPRSLSHRLMKIAARMTVKDVGTVDPALLDNIRSADPATSALLLKEITCSNVSTDEYTFNDTEMMLTRGQYDRFPDRNAAQQFVDKTSGSYYEFHGVRHTPMIECPDEFSAVITEFLSADTDDNNAEIS
ncbi:alpha/beta fold hydrolase [candidate division KSB1 bacterium]